MMMTNHEAEYLVSLKGVSVVFLSQMKTHQKNKSGDNMQMCFIFCFHVMCMCTLCSLN